MTAYENYLMQETVRFLVYKLMLDTEQQNPQTFDLLEATGDSAFTNKTFEKATKLLIKRYVKESKNE
jgi:hypothetical protein